MQSVPCLQDIPLDVVYEDDHVMVVNKVTSAAKSVCNQALQSSTNDWCIAQTPSSNQCVAAIAEQTEGSTVSHTFAGHYEAEMALLSCFTQTVSCIVTKG